MKKRNLAILVCLGMASSTALTLLVHADDAQPSTSLVGGKILFPHPVAIQVGVDELRFQNDEIVPSLDKSKPFCLLKMRQEGASLQIPANKALNITGVQPWYDSDRATSGYGYYTVEASVSDSRIQSIECGEVGLPDSTVPGVAQPFPDDTVASLLNTGYLRETLKTTAGLVLIPPTHQNPVADQSGVVDLSSGQYYQCSDGTSVACGPDVAGNSSLALGMAGYSACGMVFNCGTPADGSGAPGFIPGQGTPPPVVPGHAIPHPCCPPAGPGTGYPVVPGHAICDVCN